MTDDSRGDGAKSGHGGKRPGAGRRKKVRAATVIDEADIRLLVSEIAPDHVETAAQRHARLAIAALVKKLVVGVNEAARVVAANAILDRGFGKPGIAGGGDAVLPFMPSPGMAPVSSEIRTEARKYANLAIEVLRRIAEFGASESASVTAAKSLLDRGLGTVAPARVPDDLARRPLGKREQESEDAQAAAIGIFAPPKPPEEKLQ